MARTKEFKDYYKILNISDSANQEAIKKSYRKLALELHPDHNPNDPASEDKFKEITEAYGVLSDPKKKQEYDRFRSDYLSGRNTSSSHFRYSQEDIFSSMFQGQNVRDIFEELNREFSRSGVRSGNSFFESIFFGGAVPPRLAPAGQRSLAYRVLAPWGSHKPKACKCIARAELWGKH